MKRSIGEFGQDAAFTSGGTVSLIGWKAQCGASFFGEEGVPIAVGFGAPTAGHSAPERTQSVRAATSASERRPFGGILRSSA